MMLLSPACNQTYNKNTQIPHAAVEPCEDRQLNARTERGSGRIEPALEFQDEGRIRNFIGRGIPNYELPQIDYLCRHFLDDGDSKSVIAGLACLVETRRVTGGIVAACARKVARDAGS